jgi:hypothetical protein
MIPGNTYKITNTATHSTAITILQARSHATRPLVVTRVWVEAAATVAAAATIQVLRQTTAGTMTTLSPGPLPMRPNVATAGMTAGHTATAEPTAGDVLVHEEFNVVNGYLWAPLLEDEFIVVPAAGFLGLKFSVAPATQTWVYGMNCVEVG